MSQETDAFFAAYFQAFNAGNLREAARFWASDCQFRTRPGFPDLQGRQQILWFYPRLRERADERIALHRLTQAKDDILAEIGTEITARVYMPDFGKTGLAAGDRLRLRSIVAYRLRNGAIAHIEGRATLSRTTEKSMGANPATPTESCHV